MRAIILCLLAAAALSAQLPDQKRLHQAVYDDDLNADEQETLEENLVDRATAAKTIVELEAEIGILQTLEQRAKLVTGDTGRKTGFSNSEIIMLINTIIFGVAAFQFGIETAMYSVITYFTATRAIDYVVDGIEQFTAMNIISSQPEEIKNFLVNELGKGITVYKGERGYLPGSFDVKTDADIIVTIVTRLEIKQIQEALLNIDPRVFVYVQSIREASGGILKAKGHAK